MSLISLLAVLGAAGWAQGPTGIVRGKIIDPQGLPLPGASIYLRSDKIMGMKTFITTDTGKYQFQALLPGLYQLTLEMPGFKTVRIDNIVMHAGRSVNLTVPMEMTAIEEEIVLDYFIPSIDEETSKASTVIDRNLLDHIPFRHQLREAVAAAPGIIPDWVGYPAAAIVGGQSERDILYISDSLILSDPLALDTPPWINYEIAHEIHVETAGEAAETIGSGAGYINVVNRAGGPETGGELFVQHTAESLSSTLSSPKELSDQNVTPPSVHTRLWDLSLALHGTIYGNLLRFYSNIQYVNDRRSTTFDPWTDPLGNTHEAYQGKYSDKSASFRLTGKVQEFKFIGTISYTSRSYPAYSDFTAARLPEEATARFEPQTSFMMTGGLNYEMSRQTFVDLKAGYVRDSAKLLLHEAGAGLPQYIDEATGYGWGSGAFNNWHKQDRFNASVILTHFNDRFLGGNQKFKLGLEYDSANSEWNTWKRDNLRIHYLNGDPYYFGFDTSPLSGDPVGTGKISLYLMSGDQDSFFSGSEMTRLGAFIQDTITVAGRVTFNLGLRFDRSSVDLKDSFKQAAANPLSIQLGEAFIEPVALLNPYDAGQFPSWGEMLTWNSFSPRLGISIDILGNGRTLLKGAYARYHDLLKSQSVIPLNAYYFGRSHQFFWFDETQDQEVNTGDAFLPFPEDYRIYAPDSFQRVRADGIEPPLIEEVNLGIEHELFKDFSVRLGYIYKKKDRILENVLYSLDEDLEWYQGAAQEGWWIPFDTTVPAGANNYGGSALTLYYRSRNAPPAFYRLNNVLELERTYKGLELVVRKRMSNNWQFLGSVVYSKTRGNLGVGADFKTYFSPAADDPNYFVNLSPDSVVDTDIPLVVKLMGTYRFPWEFHLSLFYAYYRGTPWARDVTVVPPEQWAEDNQALAFPTRVLTEPSGSRRHDGRSSLNFRLEKDFQTGFGRVNAALDVYNTLGTRYHLFDLNDGGLWYPEAEDGTEGVRVLNPVYGRGYNLQGTREFRLTFRLFF
jgi:outer membrane receptor protein involved in Fe transport